MVAGVRAGKVAAFGKTNVRHGRRAEISQTLRLKWTEGSDASLGALGADGRDPRQGLREGP